MGKQNKQSSNRNIRIEESAVGSAIVSGDGNTIYVIHQNAQGQHDESPRTKRASTVSTVEIGENPYKGLAAFQARDAENYFGREAQIERLWQRLRDLDEQSEQACARPRLLPVLGPSGSGKSSLVRAGLIPELARRSLPGKEKLRVVIMVPGTQPLEALAGLLAKAATQDPFPVEKAQEFERVLKKRNDAGIYDGLRRIANMIPNIRDIPLVMIVDQLEEVFSLCKEKEQRKVFIATLLEAASDSTGNVSVVATLRSDFWGETQKYEGLNQIVGSDRSVNVPAMTTAELRRAIAQPAIQAGHPFDQATIDLLVNDAEGREGALPLLQFALSRIWEGLRAGKSPAETYREMGGVGGALAKKAQDIYEGLNAEEQKIARRVFIGLIQLGEGIRDTRRRSRIESLTTSQDTAAAVKQVVNRFSSPSARLISLASDEAQETAEVTHEALFDHWQLLNEWLESSREDIRFQRRLEADATYWEKQGKPDGLLWRSPDLDLLRKFENRASEELSLQSAHFFAASDQAEKREKKQKRRMTTVLLSALFATASLSILFGYKVHQAARRQMELYEARAKDLADSNELESLVNGLAAIGLGRSHLVKLPNLFREPMITSAILDRPNRSLRASAVVETHSYGAVITALEVSANGETIIGLSHSGTLLVWDQNGDLVPTNKRYQHSSEIPPIISVSADGQTIVLQDVCTGQIQLLDRHSNQITEPLRFNSDRVRENACRQFPLAISNDGQVVVSVDAKGFSIWQRQGKEVLKVERESPASVLSLAISQDGKTIVSNSADRKIRLWDSAGNPISEPFSVDNANMVAISGDGQIIASTTSGKNSVQLWDRQGNAIGDPLTEHVTPIVALTLAKNGQTITTQVSNDTLKVWNREGEVIAQREGQLLRMTPDGKTAVSLNETSSYGSFGDDTILIERDTGNAIPQLIEDEREQRISLDISEEAETVAVASSDGFIRLFNRLGKEIYEFRSSAVARGVPFFDLSEDGEVIFHMASSDRNSQNEISPPSRRLIAKNRQGNVIRKPIDQKPLPFFNPTISADQQTIVGTGHERKVHILNADGENVVSPFSLGTDVTYSNVEGISANGSIFVVRLSTQGKASIQVISRQGKLLSERLSFDPDRLGITAVAVSADGKTIAIVETVRRNEIAVVSQSVVLIGPDGKRLEPNDIEVPGRMTALALSADGTTIVTAASDGIIQRWDREGTKIGKPFAGHTNTVNSLAMSRDGSMIVSSSDDGTVRLWPTDKLNEGWITYTCDRLKNYLPGRSKIGEVAKEAKRTCDHHAWKN